jgi:hypothetical protein
MMQAADKKVGGYVQRTGAMTREQRAALQKALTGQDRKAVVIIPADNFTDVMDAPQRLYGVYINEDGDAV